MKRILVLHALNAASRRTTIDHIYSLPTYRPEHLYVFQNINAPMSPELKSVQFDAIIFNYCFLSQRSAHNFFDVQVDRFAFLKDHPAKLIAIAQDDYTDSKFLDNWLYDIGVDVIFSPIDRNLEVIYPKCSTIAEFRMGYTAYTNSAQIEQLKQYVTPFSQRTIDVGTRVRKLPPHYGRHGVLKGFLAEQFAEIAKTKGFNVDISTDPTDVKLGSEWLNFIGSCRFTIGSKGGASLNDPIGDIRRSVAAYMADYPEAPYEDVEAACFPGQDKYVFSAISPRLFEAATLRTGQILYVDDYPGDLQPYEDYIPIREDFGNLDEVFELMRDDERALSMIESCYQKLIASRAFDYSAFVDDVLDCVPERKAKFSKSEAEALRAHALRLQPYQQLHERLGGTLQYALKRVLDVSNYNNQVDLLFDLVEAKRAGRSIAGYHAAHAEVSHDPVTDDFLAMGAQLITMADMAGCLDQVELLLGEFTSGRAIRENFYPWDLCEVVAPGKVAARVQV